MTTHLIIVFLMGGALLFALRTGLLQAELIFPWFVAIIVLAALSLSPGFVAWLGLQLDIVYAPVAVIFVVLFLILIAIVVLEIALTRVRERQIEIIRHLSALQLTAQEAEGARS